MKFLRLDLLTLLISLFILNSCKNESTIGLGVTSSTELNSSMIDTATIVVNTVPEDSVVTSGLTKNALGYFQDPALGSTEANIAVALNLPNQVAYSLPTGTVTVDSAVLVLKYADGFYGDSLTSKYQLNVYQLAERPLQKAYYNTKSWSFNPTVVGTRSFFARTHDSVKIYDIITGAPDTLKRAAPQLRIPINKNFINTILFNASSAQLSSNTVFLNAVKGLYLTLDKTGTTGPGGTFMFKLTDSLNVYYRANNGTGIDTATVSLPLSTHAIQIKRTPSAAVTTELANTTGSRDVIYFQGLAGLKAKISFPYLKNIIKTLGSKVVINKAELVITPVAGSNIPYAAQPKLTMYRYDIAHAQVELPDAGGPNGNDARSAGISTFGGYYNPARKNYHFSVTAYIQDLIDGRTIDYGTYLAPVDTTNTQTVDIAPTPQTGGRTIAVGTDKNSPYRIKLNIIYTKVNN